MTTRKKVLIGIGVAALLGVMAYMAIRQPRGERVDVRTEEVGRRDLVSRVTATGHVEARRAVEISADIAGRIVELPVEEGQEVEEGDLLLRIDPTQYRAAVRKAEAAVAEAEAREARAEAAYRRASRAWERTRKLRDAGENYVTEDEAEAAETDAELARAEWNAAQHAVEQARAALNEARDRLEKTTIRAPMTGRVTRLNVDVGETAVVGTMNNPGSLLLTISDLGDMEAVLEVDETDIPRVSVGDSASVEVDAFPDGTIAGRVRKISNSSVQGARGQAGGGDQAVDFEVRVALRDPPAGIRPDLSATGDIITAVREDALAIPIIALTLRTREQLDLGPDAEIPAGARQSGEGVEGVFVVRGDSVVFRPIDVGVAGESHFEVESGLSEDDTVVSGPYEAIRQLEPGSRVRRTGETADGNGNGDGSTGSDTSRNGS
ncbi:MAG: efflux RND transporter periplasmic adaptor subunit [Candidatus Palauibacterales bacterium]|nr:efflux RND transporter periplasmic adaptor subunit [Candidatus Palauibacterales bacterium]